MTRHSLIASISAFAFAAVAHGHPGHGEPGDDFSLMHYATEPMHLGVGFCVLCSVVLLLGVLHATCVRRRRQESV